MNPVAAITLFGLAGGLFLAAAILSYWPFRWKPYRLEWAAMAGAFLLLVIFCGMMIAQQVTNPTEYPRGAGGDYPAGWLTALLLLAAGASSAAGVYFAGKRAAQDQLSASSAQTELERYRCAFDESPQMQIIKDQEGRYLAANAAAVQLLGKKGASLVGATDSDFLPGTQAAAFRQMEEEIVANGVPNCWDEEIRGSDGPRWFRITRTPFRDEPNPAGGVLVFGQDITVLKGAEAALARWKQGLITLYDAELALGDLADLSVAWESLLAWASKLADAAHGGIWQVTPDRTAIFLKAGFGKLFPAAGLQLRSREEIIWKVLQRGQMVLVTDYQNWPDCGRWGKDSKFGAAIGLPLKAKGQVCWILTLFYEQSRPTFPEELTLLLNLFAQVASSNLQNSERSTAFKNELQDRQSAYDKLQQRARLEHILAMIASRFISMDLTRVDEGIQRSLETLVKYTGIDRSYIILFPSGAGSSGEAKPQAWYSNGANHSEGGFEDLTREEFYWYLNKLNQFETIHIPRLGNTPSDEDSAAEYLHARGIKSFTAIPLVANRTVIGFLGFEALQAEVEWPADMLSLLKVSAEMFVNLLQRQWLEKVVKENQEKDNRQIKTLELRIQERDLIAEMGDLLQACRTADESFAIVTRFMQRQFPDGSGALYIIHDAKDPAELVAAWGEPGLAPTEQELVLNECWGMRRGRIYAIQDPVSEPLCGHIKSPVKAGYLCVPLMSHGTAVGVLHLRQRPDPRQGGETPEPDSVAHFSDLQQRLAVKMAEYIAMALSNLKLRDVLRSQAIRDPLTGLFNRRYMEETLDREIRRATRHAISVGIIMFDIDRMKPINDHYGHDAGDLLLKALGHELQRLFRGEDVACRYGGDEFTVVLPEATLAEVWRRAEQMREAIKHLNVQYEGHPMGPLTLSIGVAAYPDHGLTAERVLQASDAASYAAKSEGGDRIMMGRQVEV